MSEVWYKIMENYTMDIVGDTVYNVDVPRFTTIGATTDFGKLLKPFRDRFVHLYELSPYTVQELYSIIRLIGNISEEAAKSTAEISQYTPRLAKNYVKAMTEYASFSDRPGITIEEFNKLIRLKNITKFGLTDAQMRVLRALDKGGDKMGKNALAMAASLSMVDLEELVEPYLVIRGFIARTPRGREITSFGKSILSDIKI
jgi:Holliday junction DNA helicase RuvB